MVEDFVLELQQSRHQSGLTQEECAHLLDMNRTQISDIENGDRLPHLKEIIGFSILFGKSFEKLFASVFEDVRATMAARLQTLPLSEKPKQPNWRKRTLLKLKDYLESLNPNINEV